MFNYWNDQDQTLALFDDFRRHFFGGLDAPRGYTFDPRAQLAFSDDGKQFTLIAELPGVKQEDLKVSLHNDTLTISAARRIELPEGYKAHRRERPSMQFSRSFTLPAKIDADKTQAELKDGVLKLTLERAAEVQPRLIAVKAA